MPMQAKSTTNTEETSKTFFPLRNSLTKKINFICLKESNTQTEVVDEALAEYVAMYEKKNGEINF
jgi:hypothetical protein